MIPEFIRDNYRQTNWSEQFRGFRNAVYRSSSAYALAAVLINTVADEKTLLLIGAPAGLKGLHFAAEQGAKFIKSRRQTEAISVEQTTSEVQPAVSA